MPQLTVYEKPTQADKARWLQLRSIYEKNVQGVVEWCEAVIEARDTGIWMIGYGTWAEFCNEELSMARASVRALLSGNLGDTANAPQPKLTMDDEEDRQLIMASVAKSMTSSLKRLAKLLRDWPQNDVPKKKTIAEIALWMADNGVLMELRGIDDK